MLQLANSLVSSVTLLFVSNAGLCDSGEQEGFNLYKSLYQSKTLLLILLQFPVIAHIYTCVTQSVSHLVFISRTYSFPCVSLWCCLFVFLQCQPSATKLFPSVFRGTREFKIDQTEGNVDMELLPLASMQQSVACNKNREGILKYIKNCCAQ